ncbi:DUF3696 domain-containing protein [Undibacterium sp. CY18W]|uniref:DUF3696 domain-containing protein n=1 Tax=Undibacterium hunanense TaxID=2762292 RepID=A0ABR6ZZE2_9BURK|nr:DUF3696 domain-containing protein [Undibacterium hunanense]MBC3921023.1 DUF3696 domain-containing protein [Undibacterium hunanense]
MISEIRLANFKCFKQLSLPLGMFTLLTGLNGMGKSSVIQSILLMRQSWLSGDLKTGRLALNGELTELGTGYDVLFEGADADQVGIGLNAYTKTEAGMSSKIAIDFWYSYDQKSDRLTSILPDIAVNREMKNILSSSHFETVQELIQDPASLATLKIIASTEEQGLLWQGISQLQAQDQWIKAVEREAISPFGGQFHYVFAERFGPRKMLPLSETHVRGENLGLHGEYVLHFLLEYGKKILLDHDDPRLFSKPEIPRSLEAQVDAWLQEISPGSHLSIEAIRKADSVLSGFEFDRPGDIKTRAFRATNVGFGLSYVLPVIVALLSAEKGAMVLLENPEAHMHPRGQTRLGQLAARTAAAGVQVIMETHSDHIMDGARIDIRQGGIGRLAAAHAAFHYFEREGAMAKVTSPNISDDGRLDNWPAGFFDQHDENLIELLAPKTKG